MDRKQIFTALLCVLMLMLPLQVARAENYELESEEGTSQGEDYVSEDDRLMSLLYGGAAILPSSTNRMEDRLSFYEAELYRRAKTMAAQVASGVQTDTVAAIAVEETELYGRYWSAEELGVAAVVEGDAISEAAAAAMRAKLDVDFSKVFRSVLADCPYELFWSRNSYSFDYFGLRAVVRDGIYKLCYTGSLRIRFAVSENYAADPTAQDCYETDPAQISRVSGAVDNIRRILTTYSGYSDLEKLCAYRDEICALTNYNHTASGGAPDYNDPWQLVYVFDGDSSTNVVCEGYSKAFQYLCELTAFASNISVYSVTGHLTWSTGQGEHMWNVVSLADGRNLLADLTNYDNGMTNLFLANAERGSLEEGYTIGTHTYVYDSRAFSVYLPEELTLTLGSGSALTDQGKCGANAFWHLSGDTLTISGIGVVDSVSGPGKAPWAGLPIRSVVVADGITTIGSRLFQGSKELEEVTLGAGVTAIEASAFADCGKLSRFVFTAAPTQIASNAFFGDTVTVFFDRGNDWDGISDRNYSGSLTWISSTGPRILVQPTNAAVTRNEYASFSVTASGVGLQYRWQFKTPTGSWENCPDTTAGYNTVTLTPMAMVECNGYQYRCIITDGSGRSATSNAVTLKVTQPLLLLASPEDCMAEKGETVTFHAAADGIGIRYQWQFKTPDGDWANCSSATVGSQTDTIRVEVTQGRNGYLYRCLIRDNAGKAMISGAAKLIVGKPLRILSHPEDQRADVDAMAEFSVTAQGTGLRYRWQYCIPSGSWANCSQATQGYNTESIRVAVTQGRNGYLYRCEVRDGYGKILYSEPALLTVNPA